MLTRRDLDRAHCDVPGCTHAAHHGLIINARCHPTTPPTAEYKDGALTFTCTICDRLVTRVAVATELTPPVK